MSQIRRNLFLQTPYKKREKTSQKLALSAFICDRNGIDEAIKDGADLDMKDISGLTPLMLLLHHNERKNYQDLIASVGLILEASADVNIPDRLGRTACHMVCSNKYINKVDRFAVLKLIVDFKSTKAFFNQTDFSSSWKERYSKVSTRIPLIPRNVTRLGLKKLQIVQSESLSLESHEAKDDNTFAGRRHAESFSKFNRTPQLKPKKSLQLFVSWRRSKSGSNMVPVKLGCNINQVDNGGRTPMHDAAQWGFSECVSFLIQAKADINARAQNGQTPLHRATSGLHKGCISELIRWGCYLNAQDQYGNTVLHLLAKSAENRIENLFIKKTLEIIDCFLRLNQETLESRKDIIEEALDNCVDAFDPENEEQTAVVRLIAEMAVEPFVDSRLKNSDGHTAYSIAARLVNKKCCNRKIANALIPAR